MSRLSRFLHLERARAEAPADAEPSAGTAERIEGVRAPGPAPAAPRTSGAGLGRFGPAPPPRLELAEGSDAIQPFKRCMRCGMDHGVFTTECTGCGAGLDTPEQRAFNEQLWAARRADAERERAAAAEREAREGRDRAELERARRAMGEALAREVGERERRRFRADGIFGDDSSGGGGQPLGLRLLQALPDWRWQLGAIAGAVAVVGGLLVYGFRGHPGAVLVALVAVIGLLVPGWRVGGEP